MSTQLIERSTQLMPLPAPRVAVRPGTLDDVPFLDALQKLHTKQVGWMPTAQFEGKVKAGHVLVAETTGETLNSERKTVNEDGTAGPSSQFTVHRSPFSVSSPVGYCIGNDQYFKRDDVGVIYQMNVSPNHQRGFIGATLLKAMFDRAAYGCKLFCCWCAQDIAANRFWEAMGFVPLAFRAGSAKKSRVHIFWQKRIRQGDATTPWWFPSQTGGGSIREDRIVLPIPPGAHWSDAKPMILPGEPEQLRLEAKRARQPKARTANVARAPEGVAAGGLWMPAPVAAAEPVEKPKREPRAAKRNDPRLVAAARELRDRWLEEVNAGRHLPAAAGGKYDVSRAIDVNVTPVAEAATKLFAA